MTPNEMAFSSTIFGAQIDTSRVRFVRGHIAESYTVRYRARPRVTCMERVMPPPPGPEFTTSPGAISLFNKVFYRRDLYLNDYGHGSGGKANLYALMLLAHEMTHVWQWQNRDRTGYHPLRAAQEHAPGHDPYLFEITSKPDFLSYPYEQQAAIVEEYTCCRALAPKAARTQRLHALLAQHMPVARLSEIVENHAFVPWKDARTQGICT
ncbi:hypothetical protein [Thalassovita sp.]|uniref:hypothetical protein n=1 Tax=Thalassovita sp. TaxID=1979401 RepID=UPI0029DE689E|nr:hypothetical protein [Thalassovita sp.]